MAQSVPVAARRGAGAAAGDRDRDEASGLDEGRRRTRRWRGVAGLTLVALGVGLFAEEPSIVLAGVVGVAAAAFAGLGRAPEPELAVERSVTPADPAPDDEVRVRLTVRNEADRALPDLRVIDGVPAGLSVVEGSPRFATALRAGESASLSYVVETRPGEHAFDRPTAIARDLAGATEYAASLAADGDAGCTCSPPLSEDPIAFPLRPQTTRFTGRTTAEEGGTGVEFHATREYRPGDPINRIDWRRTARTRDLTTVEYRLERAAAVLLVIDARQSAAVAHGPYESTAVERSVEAAREVAASLLAAGHTVGVTAIAPDPCWLSPGRGLEHRVELRQLLASADAFGREPPADDVNVYGAVRSIRERLAGDAQVVFCTPLADDAAADAALRFDAHGHATTVLSPDPSSDATIGHQAAALGRSMRVASTRRAGVPAIDWAPEEPLERALARSQRRWSQ